MASAGRLLTLEREFERSFVANERAVAREPQGWPASLIFFHLAQWRERLRGALSDFHAGREYKPPPQNIDEFNDRELAMGHRVPLSQAVTRADAALAALIDLSETVGDQPFTWNLTRTTGDALVRNSYMHPRVHLSAYLRENGEIAGAQQLVEETAHDLRELWPRPLILGAALFNLAAARVAQGRKDEALELLEEAAPMRPDLAEAAAGDPDLAPLKDDERFEKMIGTRSSMERA
jgi:tetratricopeptide (TPR) repeat protein